MKKSMKKQPIASCSFLFPFFIDQIRIMLPAARSKQ